MLYTAIPCSGDYDCACASGRRVRDYVLRDTTGAHWPTAPAYRSEVTRPGQGYASPAQAWSRAYAVAKACAAAGCAGPVLVVVERYGAPTFTCTGPVRGACGVQHRTYAAAQACCARDQAGCQAQGGYSDRTIYYKN